MQRKVLVVEDDPTLQFVVKLTLTRLGYECIVAASGEEAVSLDLNDIRLIFMDIGLPGIDGRMTAIRIRQEEVRSGRKRVPIVALTAHSDPVQCRSAGMDDFLQKPALISDFNRMLAKYAPV